MNILVARCAPQPDGQFSNWSVDGKLFCVGVENLALKVPVGAYELRPHESKKACLVCTNGNTYALHNPDIGVWAEEWMIPKGQKGHFDCLLHPANKAHELLGCLAPGQDVEKWPDGVHGVTSSRFTFEELYAMLSTGTGHTLTITEAS